MINIRNKSLKGKSITIFGLMVTYWGLSQIYKWRWNVTHFDMGIISIYNIPQKGTGKYLWLIIAFIFKPMRIYYHNKYCKVKDIDYNSIINDLSVFK